MTFIQIMDYETSNPEDFERLFYEWVKLTEGKRTASREIHTQDREKRIHFVDIIEFPSAELTMKNSELPETKEIAERMRALCSRTPRFLNLDVRRRTEL